MTLLDAAPEKVTAVDVRAAIQRYFGLDGQQYAVLFEVRNGTAWRANRSVDAVVMSLWPSLGMQLMGMEIKVSRSDWLRETREPEKASMVFDYFDSWWLVSPANIAKVDEVPEPWGWLVVEGGTLRKVRDAARNPNVKPVDRHFLGALLRRTAKTDDAFVNKAVDDALNSYRKQVDADIEKRVLERMDDMKHDAEQWVQVRSLLKEKPTDYISLPEVIAAVRVVMKSGVAQTWSGLHSIVEALDRARDQFNTIADELGIKRVEIKRHR